MNSAALVLLVTVTFGLLFAPLDANGQQVGTLPTIGLLGTAPPGDGLYQPLLQGLHELGYADGQNLLLEWRWGEP
jgi:hypothetical protein